MPKFSSLTVLAALLLHILHVTYAQMDITELGENHLMTDLYLDERENRHFMMQVTDRYYVAGQHLTITAFATSFGSDPDIYISNSVWAHNAGDATWYCSRAGSDTCIIPASDFAMGDYFYIVVVCREECTYDLKSYYATEYNLNQNSQTPYRWNGTSTNILKYSVPKSTSSGASTGRWKITIDPQYRFEQIQVYLSLDDHFNLVEEKQEALVLEDSVIIQQTRQSANWCTDCDVYIILVTVGDRRVYIKTDTSNYNEEIDSTIATKATILRNQIECYSYTVLSKDQDLVFYVQNYQGHMDAFVSALYQPTSTSSSSVKLISKRQEAQYTLIIRSYDRDQWNAETGNYFICGLAYSATTTSLLADQLYLANNIVTSNRELFSMWLYNDDYFNFNLNTGELRNSDLLLHVNLGVYNQQGDTSTSKNTTILVQLCTSDSCNTTAQSPDFKRARMREVVGAQGKMPGQILYRLPIQHNKTHCDGQPQCYFIFQVYNPDGNPTPVQIEYEIDYQSQEYANIDVNAQIIEDMKMDQQLAYKIVAEDNYFEYIDSLTIELISTFGDADLNCEIDGLNFGSFSKLKFDQVRLEFDQDGVKFASDLIIYVDAKMSSHIELNIYPSYRPNVQSQLSAATPLVERKAFYISMTEESDQALVSYRPWWSHHENRTICFVADNMQNNIYYYAELDKYPMNYDTDLFDNNGILTIDHDNPKYMISQGVFGTYFVRIRPSYKFANLVQNDDYSLNFYAFSQPREGDFADLYANNTQMGVANSSKIPTQYRHLLIAANETVQITLTGIYGKGFPKLMVKISNMQTIVNSNNFVTYDFIEQISAGQQSVQITLNNATRMGVNPTCAQAGYANGTAGNPTCGIYIGVQCGDGEEVCAYKVKLQSFMDDDATEMAHYMPHYMTWNKDYIQGAVEYQHSKFYYLPIDPGTLGKFAILVNKTTPLESQNGDLNVSMIIHPGAGLRYYQRWVQPTYFKSMAHSANSHPYQPEIIEICEDSIQSWCGFKDYPECSLMFRLDGLTPQNTSFYRIKIFNGTNAIEPDQPIAGNLYQAGQMQYFWFVSKAAAVSYNATWAYDIGLGIQTVDGDADLYVSVMDGRYPTENDYDYYSDLIGTDFVRISSEDPIFSQAPSPHHWDDNQGVMIVVGVLAYTDNIDFTLTVRGPNVESYNFTDLATNKQNIYDIPYLPSRTNENPQTFIYRWFNWYSMDFTMSVTQFSGSASYYLNVISQDNLQENFISGVGIGAGNSIWTAQPPMGTVSQFSSSIYQDTFPQFCYNCWYYLTVVIGESSRTQYKVQFNQITNNGTSLPVLKNDEQFQIQSQQPGIRRWTKFLLDSSDPFDVELQVAYGVVSLEIVLDPTSIDSSIWSLQDCEEGTHSIRVNGGDPNFHIGTYYYLNVFQTQPGSSSVAVKYMQDKTVQILPNGIMQKYIFAVDYQKVMHFALQVPVTNSINHQVQLNFTGVEDHQFYPTVYINQYQTSDEPNLSDLKTLSFPTIQNYHIKFGDELKFVSNRTEIHDFSGQCQQSYCYYLITVYQNSYGLDDIRKPQFQLTALAWQLVNNTPSPSAKRLTSQIQPQLLSSHDFEAENVVEFAFTNTE